MDFSTNGAWSKTGVSAASPPSARASSGSFSLTSLEIATELPSGVAVIEIPRLGLPLVRAIEVDVGQLRRHGGHRAERDRLRWGRSRAGTRPGTRAGALPRTRTRWRARDQVDGLETVEGRDRRADLDRERLPTGGQRAGRHGDPVGAQRGRDGAGVESGRRHLGQVGSDDEVAVPGAGDGGFAHAGDAGDLRDHDVLQLLGELLLVPGRARGQHQHREVVRAAGEDLWVHVRRQLSPDPVDGRLDLGNRVVQVGAERELELDGGGTLTRGGGDPLKPGSALDSGLDRLGDLPLDDLGRGTLVGGDDDRGGEVEGREQLLLELRNRDQPEAGHDDRDHRDETPVVQTEPGQPRHPSLPPWHVVSLTRIVWPTQTIPPTRGWQL